MKLSLAMVALVALTGSCHYGIADIASAPDNPTYNKDVYPLLADHCLLCHSSPPNRGAPSTFRLDVYDDTTVGNTFVAGAKSYGPTIVYDVQIGKMPPGAKSGDGVGPNGLKMLENWQNSDPQYPQ